VSEACQPWVDARRHHHGDEEPHRHPPDQMYPAVADIKQFYDIDMMLAFEEALSRLKMLNESSRRHTQDGGEWCDD
jgi:hypothetical protein